MRETLPHARGGHGGPERPPRGHTSPESLSWLLAEKENKFTVHVQLEAGSRVPVHTPHQAADGTRPSGRSGQTAPSRAAPLLGAGGRGLLTVVTCDGGRGRWEKENQNICAPTLPPFVTELLSCVNGGTFCRSLWGQDKGTKQLLNQLVTFLRGDGRGGGEVSTDLKSGLQKKNQTKNSSALDAYNS